MIGKCFQQLHAQPQFVISGVVSISVIRVLLSSYMWVPVLDLLSNVDFMVGKGPMTLLTSESSKVVHQAGAVSLNFRLSCKLLL